MILSIQFLWGRYHATPWGASVNSGDPEWPPSHWRVLRALIATWYNRVPNADVQLVESLLQKLATTRPVFWLPKKLDMHTRHYMPDEKHYPVPFSPSTDLILDQFVMLPRHEGQYTPLIVQWEGLQLSTEENELLGDLAKNLSYLGRAESICIASVLDELPAEVEDKHLIKCSAIESGDPGLEDSKDLKMKIRDVLCVKSSIEQESLMETLTVTSREVRNKHKSLLPPETELVPYFVPQDWEPKPRQAPPPSRNAEAVIFNISSNARPSIYSGVVMAEALRAAAMSKYGTQNNGGVSERLSGKTATGTPLDGKHSHAHYIALCSPNNQRRSLDKLIVWCPDGPGFNTKEIDALFAIKRLSGKNFTTARDFRSCSLGFEGYGSIADIADWICSPSKIWISETPFAPAWPSNWRMPKKFNQIENSIKRECKYRDIPEPTRIDISKNRLDWSAFRTYRHTGKGRGINRARFSIGLEIEFPVEVKGPIILGALSHFGLGVFKPKQINQNS